MKLLKGHISPETAYVVDDYPYGFRLRCSIRDWIEYKPSHGCRFMSQTTNPKRLSSDRSAMWNKPKGGTYCRFGMAMYLDANGHVQSVGLTEYSDSNEAHNFITHY